MTDAVEHLTETALEAPYAEDRRDALERLCDTVEAGVDASTGRRVVRTLERVLEEATYGDERQLAREALAGTARSGAAPDRATTALARAATDAGRPDERREAVEQLARVGEDVPARRAAVRDALATVASEDSMARNRERARERLTDLEALADEREEGAQGDGDEGESDTESGRSAERYLGVSLAEHLERATEDTAADCRRRAEELRDFLDAREFDAGDDAAEVRERLDRTVAQLGAQPDDATLDPERRDRVQTVADRARRLFLRE